MSKIQLTATFKIHDGKLAEFKSLAEQAIAVVKEKDPGTQQYDWFFNEDQTVCTVRESYVDSDAVMAHMGNVGPLLEQFAAVGDLEVEVFGTPSEALAQAAAAMQPKVWAPFGGID